MVRIFFLFKLEWIKVNPEQSPDLIKRSQGIEVIGDEIDLEDQFYEDIDDFANEQGLKWDDIGEEGQVNRINKNKF